MIRRRLFSERIRGDSHMSSRIKNRCATIELLVWRCAVVLLLLINFASAATPHDHFELVATLAGSGGEFAYFSPDGARLLTVGGDQARLWDVRSLKPLGAPFRHPATISSAGWTASGDRIFTAGGNEVRIWDGRSVNLVGKLTESTPVKVVRFSSDGKLAVTGSVTGFGTLWEVAAGAKVRALAGPGQLVSAAFLDSDKKLLIVGRVEARPAYHIIRVVDLKTDRDLLSPVRNDIDRSCDPMAETSPDGSKLAVAMNKGFKVLSLNGGTELFNIEYDEVGLDSGFSQAVRFTPDGSGVIWSVDDWTRLYNSTSGEAVGKKTSENITTVMRDDLACNRDGSLLFFAGLKKNAGVWDLRSGQRIQPFSAHYCNALSLTANAELIAVAYPPQGSVRDGFVELWHLRKPEK